MDLLGTIRKSGSRGGVNFSWDEVANSSHRENYLGHSLKAPVGRWQKGKDLNWYAKSESTPANADETDEERLARERKEELRKIKEAEEDAIARTLGLPPPQRNTSGANSTEVGTQRNIGPASGPPPDQDAEPRRERSRRHGDSDRRDRRRHRSRSRERRHRRHSRDRDDDRARDRSRDRRDRGGDEHRRRGERSRSREDRRERRRRDRSQDRNRERRRSRSREYRKRSRSPAHLER